MKPIGFRQSCRGSNAWYRISGPRSLICVNCRSPDLPRSRLRVADCQHLLMLRYPVRCRRSRMRHFVRITQARRLGVNAACRYFSWAAYTYHVEPTNPMTWTILGGGSQLGTALVLRTGKRELKPPTVLTGTPNTTVPTLQKRMA